MTNSPYYSNDYIKVHLIEKDYGTTISFWYDPPPSLWIFHTRIAEELEQELYNVLQEFVNKLNTKTTQAFMAGKLEQIFRFWMQRGWLTINPIYDLIKENE